MESCSRKFISHLDPPGEAVEIPYESGAALCARFSEDKTGAGHCQHDNPTIGQEILADELADRFGIDRRTR